MQKFTLTPELASEFFLALGLADADDTVKMDIIAKIEEQVEKETLQTIMMMIPDSRAGEFEKADNDALIKLYEEFEIDPIAISIAKAMEIREEIVSQLAYARGVMDGMKQNEEK